MRDSRMARMVARASSDFQKALARKEQVTKEMNSDSNEQDWRDSPGYRERVFEIVRQIPQGRVMTYGQIAEMLGEGYTPRTVGFVMHAADEETTPWHRVINSQGACSTGRIVLPPDKQQRMLEAEGVVFDVRGRCQLGTYRWTPDEDTNYQTDERDDEQPSLFRD